jgi:hypothetical protein
MAIDDGAFGRRFDGGAAEFARLLPDCAETVASNRWRVWRTDLPIEELKRRAAAASSASDTIGAIEQTILAALTNFVKGARAKKPNARAAEFAKVFPDFVDSLSEEAETAWYWRDDLTATERQARVAEAFASLPHAERLKHVRRPEECNEAELLAPIWPEVNMHLGTNARSLPELVEQLGVARFGHRPKIADTFCGGGSIPFEAARIGCDVYASDLNPVACTLTRGRLQHHRCKPGETRGDREGAVLGRHRH